MVYTWLSAIYGFRHLLTGGLGISGRLLYVEINAEGCYLSFKTSFKKKSQAKATDPKLPEVLFPDSQISLSHFQAILYVRWIQLENLARKA